MKQKKQFVRLTESDLHRIIKDCVEEARAKITPRNYNIDGAEYTSTNKIKGGGAWHPGFKFKDHESHNPNKLKSYRMRKDGYRYAQDYSGNPNDLHKYLTSESINNVIKKSINNILEAQRYSGEYDSTGRAIDDNEYVESLDYIIDSIINGNHSQAKEMMSKLSHSEIRELILLAREYGYEDKVLNCL